MLTLAVTTLTGCQNQTTEPTLNPLPPSASDLPSTTPSPSVSPSAPVENPDNAVPVNVDCSRVVDAQTMYDFNPNFGLLSNFSPDAGSLAAQAVARKGVACRWLNQTSGVTLDVSIAMPGPETLEAAKSLAKSGSAVSGFGDTAYFSNSGGTGALQVFAGDYWLTTTSVFYSQAADAASIMNAALKSIGKG